MLTFEFAQSSRDGLTSTVVEERERRQGVNKFVGEGVTLEDRKTSY